MELSRECTIEPSEAIETADPVSEALCMPPDAPSLRASLPRRDRNGERRPGDTGVLWFVATNSAGIAWSGCDWWLYAASVDEALHRWLLGEGSSVPAA
jgi:hypothetical protein